MCEFPNLLTQNYNDITPLWATLHVLFITSAIFLSSKAFRTRSREFVWTEHNILCCGFTPPLTPIPFFFPCTACSAGVLERGSRCHAIEAGSRYIILKIIIHVASSPVFGLAIVFQFTFQPYCNFSGASVFHLSVPSVFNMTSGMPHAEHVAYIEETFEDDDNTTVPGSRRNANVAAKRSKPKAESGKAIVKQSTQNRSSEVDLLNEAKPQITEHVSQSSTVRMSESMKSSTSKGKERASEKGRGIIGKLVPKSKKSDRAPSNVESRGEAARMHLSGAPIRPPPIMIHHPHHGVPVGTMMPQPIPMPPLQIPPPPPPPYQAMGQPANPGFPPPLPMGHPMHHRPASYHAGIAPPIVFNDPSHYPQGFPGPSQQHISPSSFTHPRFMPGPSPTSPQRMPEYPFPPSVPYHHPHREEPLQRAPSHRRRSVVFVEPNSNQETPWGSLPESAIYGLSRQPSLRRREVIPARMPGGWYDEEQDLVDQERRERALDREMTRERIRRAHLEREMREMELERKERELLEQQFERERLEREHMERERLERARLDRERMPPPPPPQIHQIERPPMRRPATTGAVHAGRRRSLVGSGPPDMIYDNHTAYHRNHGTILVDEDVTHSRRRGASSSSHKSFGRQSTESREREARKEQDAIVHQQEAAKSSKNKFASPTADEVKRSLQRRTKTQASETGSHASKTSKTSRKSGSSEGRKKRAEKARKEDGEEKMTLTYDANRNLKVDIVGDQSKNRTFEIRQAKDNDGGVALSIGGNGQREDQKYHTSVNSARSGRSRHETIDEDEPSTYRPSSSVRESEYTHTHDDMRDNASTRDVGSTRATAGSRRASLSRESEYVKRTITSSRRTGSSRDTEYMEGVRPESRMSRATTTVDDPPGRNREDGTHRTRESSHSHPPISGRWDFNTEERPRGSSRAPRAPSRSFTDDHPRGSSRASRIDNQEYRRESRVYRDPSRDSRVDRSPSPRKRDATRVREVTTITKTSSRSTIPEKSPSSSPQEEDFALANKLSAIQISATKGIKSERSPSPQKRASPPATRISPKEPLRTPSPPPREKENVSKVQSRASDADRHVFPTEWRSRRRSSSAMPGIRYVRGERRSGEGDPF